MQRKRRFQLDGKKNGYGYAEKYVNSFVTTNVPFVLFAIGVESPRFSFMKKKRRFELTFSFCSCKAAETDELPRTKQLVNEIVNSLLIDLDRNWQVKLKSSLRLQIHLLLHETYQLLS